MTDKPLVDLKEVLLPPDLTQVTRLYDIEDAARRLSQACPIDRRKDAFSQ